jgi:predicted GNAT family N-acyltransferase
VEVVALSPAEVLPLRRAVLRAHQRLEEVAFGGDDAPSSFHAGVREQGELVGVATICEEGHPVRPARGDWRVRGMATVPTARGRGVGGALLAACLDHARAHGGRRVWCTARTPAAALYARAGFLAETAPYELPSIGPHVRMALDL